jgi:hypothetical protein
MKSWGRKGRGSFLLLLFALLAMRGHAVLFKDTGDPSYNTNAPTGSLTNSGWQYEGQWNTVQGGFLGTAIAPTFFVVAQHVGGVPGDVFVLNGFTYHTVTNYNDPSTDLQIWQVMETFPAYAPLYTLPNEVSKLCVVFGRGKQRGAPVIVSGVTNGWAWGTTDFVERWGENTVSGVVTNPPYGAHLQANFNRTGGVTNECMLAIYDSSGGMFIQDGTTWKLAGIHHFVSDPLISTNGVDGTGFNAAMLDYGGVYLGGDGSWALVNNQPADSPAYFLSTRISERVAWINSVINYEPGPDLQITGNQIVGADEQINLSTGSNRLYRVDYTSDMVTPMWATLTNNLPGTGGIVTIVDPGAASQPQRFYRVTIVQ